MICSLWWGAVEIKVVDSVHQRNPEPKEFKMLIHVNEWKFYLKINFELFTYFCRLLLFL